MVKPLLTLLVVFLSLPGYGQSDLAIGSWDAFLPFQVGNTVTQSDNSVYYGSVNGLLRVNKETEEVEFFSKVNGLSDVNISHVKFHTPTGTLIVVYENSGIDLIDSDGIQYLNNIKGSQGITGSKAINNIYTDSGNSAYFSCDFGLVELNMATRKFGFTTFTLSPVNGFTRLDNTFFMATAEGIFRLENNGGQLPGNFAAWEHMGEEAGLTADYNSLCIAVYQNTLFTGIEEDIYRYDNGFYLWDSLEDHYVEFLSPEGSELMAGFRCPGDVCNGKVFFYNLDGKTGEHGFQCVGLPTYVIQESSGKLWYADEYPGIRHAGSREVGCESLQFNAPYSDKSSELAIQDGILFVATGGVTDAYGYLNRRDGFLLRQDKEWSYFNHSNVIELNDAAAQDYFRILPHPDKTRVYVGTYYAGLIEYDYNTFLIHDKDNSILQGAVGDPARTRIAGLAFDDEANLWISNYLSPSPVVVKKADGSWKSFTVPRTELGQVVIDQRGYKWFAVITTTEGVLVYDDNRTIDNASDDRYTYFNASNSELPTNLLSALAVDRDGDIWVGTREGPVIFDGAQDPFSNGSHGYRVKVDQDGVISYLLFEEEVTAIAIDGANRKWLGTKNGIFVQSPDGETEVVRYNTGNSPLLHNTITDIVIDPGNGDVYIGTDAGINVLRTDAIAGGSVHSSNVYAFPNPVRPEYSGPIAIRGLAEDAIVKITDVHGGLVFETQALGGQAIWDGNDLGGEKAASGVYLVFSTTQSQFDKPDAIVTKILVVR